MKIRRLFKHKWILVIIIVILMMGMFFYVDQSLMPNVLVFSEQQLKQIAIDAFNEAFAQAVRKDYGNLIDITTDKDGNIIMLKSNSLKINQIANDVAKSAQEKLTSSKNEMIGIKLGNAIGGRLFSDMGPTIYINIEVLGNVTYDHSTEFEGAGINQTIHRAYIKLHANVSSIVAGYRSDVEVDQKYLIDESIIVGKIPENLLGNIGIPEQSNGGKLDLSP